MFTRSHGHNHDLDLEPEDGFAPQRAQDAKQNLSNLAVERACSWCAEKSSERLPSTFCWTKMQGEAGQALDVILSRKNIERSAGSGVFFWGVGNSLRPRIGALVRAGAAIQVFFSPMRSKPKRIDLDPELLFCWTKYTDLNGTTNTIPLHALVLSRGSTSRGSKTAHYAMVCHSSEPLSLKPIARVDISHCRNWQSNNPRVGSSQVSAVLEHHSDSGVGISYHVTARATLAAPYFITLSHPLLLRQDGKRELDRFVESNPSAREWPTFVAEIRKVMCKPL